MPWNPSYDAAEPDPRLDPFRGRAARLTAGDGEVGHALVETDYLAEQVGGRLWWRRWGAPQEFAEVHTLLGGRPGSELVMPADIGAHVAEWAAGAYTVGATTYGLTWLDEAESERVHRDVFDHHH